MTDIGAVIFDWGGVLIEEPTDDMRQLFAQELGVSVKEFNAVYAQFNSFFEKGLLTEEEMWQHVCKELGVAIPSQESLWAEVSKKTFHDKAEMVEVLRDVTRTGRLLGLLSNTEKPTQQCFQEKAYSDWFDVVVFSWQIYALKPEPQAYRAILDKLQISPSEAVHIDDRKGNIDAARDCGMYAILVKNAQQVRNELQHLGVQV